MRRFPKFLLAGSAAFVGLASLFAQDAAAPMRRSSPSPENATPTPTPIATPRPPPPPTPIPQPTPAATVAPIPAPPPRERATIPAPPEAESGTKQPTSPVSATPKRGILNEKPVRAVEPIKPFPQRSPAPAPARVRGTATPKPASPLRAEPRAQEASRAAKTRKPDAARATKSPLPFFRRAPEPRADGPRAMRPTFDVTEDGNWPTAATLRSLENKWQAAIKRHDVEAVDALLRDDFEGTSSGGREGSKAKLLSEVRKDKNVYRSARLQEMKVRSLGPNVAIVSGIATEKGMTPEGKPFKSSRRFTDKWENRNGRWQCVASKVARLSDR